MSTGENLRLLGPGTIYRGEDVTIGDNVTINVTEKLVIGPRSHIGDNFTLEGRDIEIGPEFWSGHHCQIGGGSRFDKPSRLKIGYWGHLGDFSMINTARPVIIGDEVGMGVGTKIYTHGAYLSFLDGFPVEFGPVNIGSHVWLPGATVLPNVTIGDNVVVGAGAVVTKNLPPRCLAAGVPARVIKENCYPAELAPEEKSRLLRQFMDHFHRNIVMGSEIMYDEKADAMSYRGATFDLRRRVVSGESDDLTETLRNELRRYGVRFKSYPKSGRYRGWDKK